LSLCLYWSALLRRITLGVGTGLKEARVGELNNLIAEFEQERGRAQLHSVLQEDDR
jgi:hypothetical protein